MTETSSATSTPVSAPGKDVVYVSWGGTGRAASLRTAVASANENNASLVVLAVLDPEAFSDLDTSFAVVVSEELEWLTEAQIELAKTQLGTKGLETRVVVRRGDVSAEVLDVAQKCDAGTVLVGAPLPVSGHESVDSLIANLQKRLQCNVLLISP